MIFSCLLKIEGNIIFCNLVVLLTVRSGIVLNYRFIKPEMRSLLLLLILLLLFSHKMHSQAKLPELRAFNIERYVINLEINDSTDLIKGSTAIIARINTPIEEIVLDLASRDPGGMGLTVDSVLKNGQPADFTHRDNKLSLPVSDPDTGKTEYTVFYHGKPANGLMISKNIYGDRTFFAVNRPNFAHYWFPCVDHPSMKACVDFIITAPSHYQVIADGLLKKRVSMPRNRTSHYWSSSVPVPVRDILFAAAGFAVDYPGYIDGVHHSSWVFPQNMDEGFKAFTVTPDILGYFSDLFGPFPFEKIANVQTPVKDPHLFNMEKYSPGQTNMFGDHPYEFLLVHDFARNWFGKSLTESDWPHIWLSEGIPAYLTDLYVEKHYGPGQFKDRLTGHRQSIIDYSKIRLAPVVDTHTGKLTDLINPNSHQKSAWVLHMLEKKTGREALLEILQEFYNAYSLSNASTDDLLLLAEKVTGIGLDEFADDWLYSAGHPQISLNTRYNNGRFMIELIQMQQHKMAFTFPVDIKLVFEDGSHNIYNFDIMFRRHEFVLDLPSEPLEIIIDPDVKLLFELTQ